MTFHVIRRAFIKLHHDIRIEHRLNLHAHLRREKQLVAVHRRGKAHAFFADLAHLAKRPHLKAAAIGQDRFVPTFKLMQPAKLLHDVLPRPHPQMKGVAQNNLRTHLMQAARHHALHGAIRAHRHKDRRLHHAMIQRECASAGVG